MEDIHVLIVEDKLLVAEAIAGTLQRHGFRIGGKCASGEEAVQFLEAQRADLVLMDIELAGAMDGISAAMLIQEKYHVPIIYLSDFADARTLDRAKRTFPANYLTKPFQEADLVRALDIAFYNANASPQRSAGSLLTGFTFLRTESQTYIKLAHEAIVFLRAARSYCEIITTTKTYTLSNSMVHVHEQLKSPDFIRVHRSYVVNVVHISEIEGNTIRLGEHKLQMGSEYRDELVGRLNFLK
jgi:DNA-binding LytR/AlgR family response regulator